MEDFVLQSIIYLKYKRIVSKLINSILLGIENTSTTPKIGKLQQPVIVWISKIYIEFRLWQLIYIKLLNRMFQNINNRWGHLIIASHSIAPTTTTFFNYEAMTISKQINKLSIINKWYNYQNFTLIPPNTSRDNNVPYS